MIDVKPLFKLGQVVATPGAIEALERAEQTPWSLVARHVAGDWGDLSEDDRQLNNEALKDGSRLLSAYILKTGEKLWAITEAQDDHGNRAATTLLLPDEY
jgi:LysM repeat protein